MRARALDAARVWDGSATTTPATRHGRYFSRWLDELGGVYHDHRTVRVPSAKPPATVSLRDAYVAAQRRKRRVGVAMLPLVPRVRLVTPAPEEHARTGHPAGFVSQRALAAAVAAHKVDLRA